MSDVGRTRGPIQAFGRRATQGSRDGFLGLEALIDKQNQQQEEQTPGSSKKGKKKTNSPKKAKSPAVASPSSTEYSSPATSNIHSPPPPDIPTSSEKVLLKGGGGKSPHKLVHARSATLMHPPPEVLTAVPEGDSGDGDDDEQSANHIQDMNDIDRVLEDLRSVTHKDDIVGYKKKGKKNGGK